MRAATQLAAGKLVPYIRPSAPGNKSGLSASGLASAACVPDPPAASVKAEAVLRYLRAVPGSAAPVPCGGCGMLCERDTLTPLDLVEHTTWCTHADGKDKKIASLQHLRRSRDYVAEWRRQTPAWRDARHNVVRALTRC